MKETFLVSVVDCFCEVASKRTDLKVRRFYSDGCELPARRRASHLENQQLGRRQHPEAVAVALMWYNSALSSLNETDWHHVIAHINLILTAVSH